MYEKYAERERDDEAGRCLYCNCLIACEPEMILSEHCHPSDSDVRLCQVKSC